MLNFSNPIVKRRSRFSYWTPGNIRARHNRLIISPIESSYNASALPIFHVDMEFVVFG